MGCARLVGMFSAFPAFPVLSIFSDRPLNDPWSVDLSTSPVREVGPGFEGRFLPQDKVLPVKY